MVQKKNEILDFLQNNSGIKSGLLRYFTIIDEFDFAHIYQKLVKVTSNFFFFSKPEENFQFIAFGHLDFNAKNKYDTYLNNKSLITSNIDQLKPLPYQDIKVPLFIGHKKFADDKMESLWDEFATQEWFIPKVVFINQGKLYIMVVNLLPGDNDITFLDMFDTSEENIPDSNNSVIESRNDNYEEWILNVTKSLDKIKSGNIEKVVLARRIQNEVHNFSLQFSLNELQKKYSECFVFAYKKSKSIFFGATPEKLFSINGSQLNTEAIAGSYSRGKDFEEDLLYEKNLLSNKKELNEHRNVVDFIRENLHEFVATEPIEDQPEIKKLKNIQHIRTNITANVKDGINILDIVNKLHPTPAVCGLPKKEAFELIESTEKFDRGLYSGILGWFNEHQVGEFIVGLRSALFTNNNLYAFAGCGIVEGSDPALEYKETEMKLKPILSLLKNENIR